MTRVFDRYEVLRRIAVGGMGEVFLAEQTGLPGFERRVILKSLLPAEGAEAAMNAQRFLDEARLAAKLNHPNVVSIFEAGAWNGRFFIAMEYIPGWNLAQLPRQLLPAGSTLEPAIAAVVIRDAARGLHHAHQAHDGNGQPLGIVHRDVSPQNIIVRRDGLTKVVDFGVAWDLNRESKTQAGTVVGKIAYMAPEQLSGDALDARGDQYALGVVLWELLTGRRLHDSKRSDLDIARAVLTSTPPHPTLVLATVPMELGDIAMKMMRPGRDRRFVDCEEAALALDQFLKAHPDAMDRLKRLLDGFGPVPAEQVNTSGPSDFVLALDRNAPPPLPAPLPPTVTVTPRPAPSRTRQLVIAVVFLAGVIGLGGGWALSGRETPAPIAEQTPVPPVAVEHPAPPPRAEPPAPTPEAVAAPAPAPTPTPVPVRAPSKAHEAKRAKVEAPPAPAESTGFLTVSTDPWTSVKIDGRPVGHTPLSKLVVAAGSHRLELSNEEEGIHHRLELRVPAGEVQKLELDRAQLLK